MYYSRLIAVIYAGETKLPCIFNIAEGLTIAMPVEDIEGFGANLKGNRFANADLLEHAQIFAQETLRPRVLEDGGRITEEAGWVGIVSTICRVRDIGSRRCRVTRRQAEGSRIDEPEPEICLRIVGEDWLPSQVRPKAGVKTRHIRTESVLPADEDRER